MSKIELQATQADDGTWQVGMNIMGCGSCSAMGRPARKPLSLQPANPFFGNPGRGALTGLDPGIEATIAAIERLTPRRSCRHQSK
jgi:hypothetical protein